MVDAHFELLIMCPTRIDKIVAVNVGLALGGLDVDKLYVFVFLHHFPIYRPVVVRHVNAIKACAIGHLLFASALT